jgi:hypothetical protein
LPYFVRLHVILDVLSCSQVCRPRSSKKVCAPPLLSLDASHVVYQRVVFTCQRLTTPYLKDML